MAKKTLTGINIQYPISRLILDGKKTIETRTYPIPPHLIGKELALVETPGKTGKFKARVIAIIQFGSSFKYTNKVDFYKDSDRHCVMPDSPWAWRPEKGKWGWTIDMIKPIARPLEIKKRIGIKYTKNLKV